MNHPHPTQASEGRQASLAAPAAPPTYAGNASAAVATRGAGGGKPTSRRARGRDGRTGFSLPDVALAGLVIAIVAMMIVPLPTPLLDVLLAANLSVSVTVLLVVLYVPDALSIATFPTLLLLTTLFRLALNVSSARLILLQANAGEVISAFGNFVVRGNYVVGAVIFLILTIIQFVVITKGSERVAEVGARFVLDAMPGKQMAIDAELRAGSIDANEARKRRHKLSRESQFYGAMDGAMKFVKGDVIASVIITIINILGGLAIGVLQKDMAATAALKKYGLLTIGDGLVSQIPALVLSTAAGVLVTRTASEEPDTPLGQELGRQLFGSARALQVAAVFVVMLGLVPGLPTLPFLLMGAGLFAAGRLRGRPTGYAAVAQEARALGASETQRKFTPIVTPWSIELDEASYGALDATPAGRLLAEALTQLREDLYQELGVPLPAPSMVSSAALAPGQCRVALFEIPAGPAMAFALPGKADDLSFTVPVVREAQRVLRTRAADFLGHSETQRLLDELEGFAGATVRNVVPKPVSLPLLVDILRRLLEEQVSIRDLKGILESLATIAPHEKDALLLTEYVRGQMRRALTHRYAQQDGSLAAITLDPMIEDSVRRAVTRTPAGSFLALAPAVARDVVSAMGRAAAEAETTGRTAKLVILTQADIRRFVRKLIEPDLPNLAVLSYQELLPEVALRSVARAHLGGIG